MVQCRSSSQAEVAKAASRWERIVAGGDPEPYVRRILYTEHVSWWRRRKLSEVLQDDVPEQPQAEVDVPRASDSSAGLIVAS